MKTLFAPFLALLLIAAAPAPLQWTTDQAARLAQWLDAAADDGLGPVAAEAPKVRAAIATNDRSEEHTSELQSLMRISYAVFCLKKKTRPRRKTTTMRST